MDLPTKSKFQHGQNLVSLTTSRRRQNLLDFHRELGPRGEVTPYTNSKMDEFLRALREKWHQVRMPASNRHTKNREDKQKNENNQETRIHKIV